MIRLGKPPPPAGCIRALALLGGEARGSFAVRVGSTRNAANGGAVPPGQGTLTLGAIAPGVPADLDPGDEIHPPTLPSGTVATRSTGPTVNPSDVRHDDTLTVPGYRVIDRSPGAPAGSARVNPPSWIASRPPIPVPRGAGGLPDAPSGPVRSGLAWPGSSTRGS